SYEPAPGTTTRVPTSSAGWVLPDSSSRPIERQEIESGCSANAAESTSSISSKRLPSGEDATGNTVPAVSTGISTTSRRSSPPWPPVVWTKARLASCCWVLVAPETWERLSVRSARTWRVSSSTRSRRCSYRPSAITEDRYAPTASRATIDRSVVTSTTRSARRQLRGSMQGTARTSLRAVSPPSCAVLTGAPSLAGAAGSSGSATGAIADAADGHDDLGVLRVVLDLGAQPLDVHVDQAGVGAVAVAPHVAQQHVAREHLPRRAGEPREQGELEGRQREQLLAPDPRRAL